MKIDFFCWNFFSLSCLVFFLSNKNWAEKNSIGKSFKFLQWIKIVSLLVIIYHLIKEMIAFHPVNIRVFGGVCVWYHIWYMRIFFYFYFFDSFIGPRERERESFFHSTINFICFFSLFHWHISLFPIFFLLWTMDVSFT